MAIETEVKIPVDKETFDRVRNQIGDSFKACYQDEPQFLEEHNIFYQVPNGFLRLRNYGGKVSVTYKGKRQESEKFNSREEIEFHYENQELDKLKLLFSRMGLKKQLEYKKQRANYQFDNGLVASFDILPNGSRYIEIEDDWETVKIFVNLLGLKNYPVEKRSYLEIMGCENGSKN